MLKYPATTDFGASIRTLEMKAPTASIPKVHYFILGPSGSGKSHFAAHLAEAKDALLVEVDLWPPRDGMVELGLKPAWDPFCKGRTFQPLDAELTARASKDRKSGCVVSLPGFPILNTGHVAVADGRATIAYLVGTPGQCLDAFLVREAQSGRGLDIVHWARNAKDFFGALRRPDIAPLILRAFEPSGKRRPIDGMIRELESRS